MSQPPHTSRAVRRVLLLTLALNLLVAAGEGAYGLWVGSLAMAANAVHSLVDAAANLVGFLVVGIAARPPDESHPYGHRKFEAMGGMFLGIAVGATAFRFGIDAISSLSTGGHLPQTGVGGFAVLGASMLVNVFVAGYEARRAKALNSPYLSADAAHTLADVLVSATVMASFAASHYGVAWADPAAALGVLVALIWIAWQVVSRHFAVLVDRASVRPEEVRSVALSIEGVLGVHRIRSRGEPFAHLDLHVAVENELSLRDAHAIAHRVEDALRAKLENLGDVLIHVEPEEDGPETL